MTYNAVEVLIENKIANNSFRAARIASRLKAWQCKTADEFLTRARLYRAWRSSQVYGKNTTPCFEMALKGEPAPEQIKQLEAVNE